MDYSIQDLRLQPAQKNYVNKLKQNLFVFSFLSSLGYFFTQLSSVLLNSPVSYWAFFFFWEYTLVLFCLSSDRPPTIKIFSLSSFLFPISSSWSHYFLVPYGFLWCIRLVLNYTSKHTPGIPGSCLLCFPVSISCIVYKKPFFLSSLWSIFFQTFVISFNLVSSRK